MPTGEALVHRVREAGGDPAGALVLLHGRATGEDDLYPLLDVLDPERRLVGLTPRGPLALPPGGAHWYAVREIGYPDPQTFLSTFELASGWLDDVLAERGLDLSRTVIGGFSQGTVMSWALGLGGGRPRPAGIVALNGFLPTVEGFELNVSGLDGFPVAIGHGTFDPIIGVEWGSDAKRKLELAGAEVTWRESPIGHSVDPDFLRELAGWVERVVP
jgi:phospholipase/carboxylesterase